MSDLEYALPAKTGDKAQLRVRMAGLMMACPVSQDNPYDCPLQAVRRLTLGERYRWLESLETGQLKKFLDQHAECIGRREQEEREPA